VGGLEVGDAVKVAVGVEVAVGVRVGVAVTKAVGVTVVVGVLSPLIPPATNEVTITRDTRLTTTRTAPIR
jgi:hypothetical protein